MDDLYFINAEIFSSDFFKWLYSVIGCLLVGLTGVFPFLIFRPSATSSIQNNGGVDIKSLNCLLSFAVGSLLGDAFLHLLPEAWERSKSENALQNKNLESIRSELYYLSIWVLIGIISFVICEKLLSQNEEEEDNLEENKSCNDLKSQNNSSDIIESDSLLEKQFTKSNLEKFAHIGCNGVEKLNKKDLSHSEKVKVSSLVLLNSKNITHEKLINTKISNKSVKIEETVTYKTIKNSQLVNGILENGFKKNNGYKNNLVVASSLEANGIDPFKKSNYFSSKNLDEIENFDKNLVTAKNISRKNPLEDTFLCKNSDSNEIGVIFRSKINSQSNIKLQNYKNAIISELNCDKLTSNETLNHENLEKLQNYKITESLKNEKNLAKSQTKEENKSKKITGYLNLLANIFDNFTHGLAIGGSFIISPKTGFLTTAAILIHEIPHEISDFAILLRSGFSAVSAAKAQLGTASVGLLGAFLALGADWAKEAIGNYTWWILPYTGGAFICIALTNLLPDLLKEENLTESFKQIGFLFLGILVMGLMSLFV